jgi:hypothetical protein
MAGLLRTATLAALLVLVGCGEDPVAPPETSGLTGFWEGATDSGIIVELGITDKGDGLLDGCASFGFRPEQAPQDRITVDATGTVSGPDIFIEIPAGFAITWSLAGTRTSDDEISGTAAGAAPGVITFERTALEPGC